MLTISGGSPPQPPHSPAAPTTREQRCRPWCKLPKRTPLLTSFPGTRSQRQAKGKQSDAWSNPYNIYIQQPPHPDRALEVPMAPMTQKLEPEYLRGFETKSRPPVASPPTPPITASRARSLSLYGLQIAKQPREKDRRCV